MEWHSYNKCLKTLTFENPEQLLTIRCCPTIFSPHDVVPPLSPFMRVSHYYLPACSNILSLYDVAPSFSPFVMLPHHALPFFASRRKINRVYISRSFYHSNRTTHAQSDCRERSSSLKTARFPRLTLQTRLQFPYLNPFLRRVKNNVFKSCFFISYSSIEQTRN